MSRMDHPPVGHVLQYAIGDGWVTCVDSDGETLRLEQADAPFMDTRTPPRAERDNQRKGRALPWWCKWVFVAEEAVERDGKPSGGIPEVP